MSDTPRTDAATFTVMLAPSTLDNAMMLPRKVVPVALAHKLERELSAVTRERDEARAEVTRLIAEVVNRNKRALDGDQAIHVANKLIDDNDALRAEVERLSQEAEEAQLTIESLRAVIWDDDMRCCGCPEIGAEYMGAREQVCCGKLDPTTPTDAERITALRVLLPASQEPTPVLLANLAILGLNLKLYTEILKDKAQDVRTRKTP